MIVDGVEVLYTMRNGKIVDPNIPTDGLVCYLDTRGKYNTDVYRNTLLDLSGNGNHGTLQNFNFTDGSGYENGGLKFDGVDDRLTLNLDMSQDFTIFTELNVPATMKGNMIFTITCTAESFYSEAWIHIIKNYTLFQLKKKGLDEFESLRHFSMRDGGNKIAVRKNGDKITMFANETKVELVLANNLIPNKLAWFGKATVGEGGEITDIKIYNIPLTDEEITQLMEV